MAYSMMSSTNYKRKCLSSPTETDRCSSKENDSISFDLEDYASNSFDIEDSSFFSSSRTSSIDSDYVASDFLLYEYDNLNHEKLTSKKRKTMECFVDQELEDTASSPVHSPKINDLKLFYMKSKEMDSREVSQEKGQSSQEAGYSSNMSLIESELRKKGLCLIPTSMLFNYLTTDI